jgi:CheY-like chemotaxis protein
MTDAPVKTKCRTLVVEDDADSRAFIVRLLEMTGHEAFLATSVREGIEALRHHPRCLVLDLGLPDGNGLEVLEHVRTRNLPIMVAVVTADPRVHDLLRRSGLKADAVFEKPLDVEPLLKWLEEVA